MIEEFEEFVQRSLKDRFVLKSVMRFGEWEVIIDDWPAYVADTREELENMATSQGWLLEAPFADFVIEKVG